MRRSLAAFALVATLTGCGAQDDLDQCLDETEPIIRLRQLNLTPALREKFERCYEVEKLTPDECAVAWLDAQGPVLNCMKRHGWTFTGSAAGYGDCLLTQFRWPSCYKLRWLVWRRDPELYWKRWPQGP
jgi:hypothetical protein